EREAARERHERELPEQLVAVPLARARARGLDLHPAEVDQPVLEKVHAARLAGAAVALRVAAGGAGEAKRSVAARAEPRRLGNLLDYTVETLTTIDEAGRILPLLAEGWTVSADGRQYTFRLRPGVRFHDGSPFDAKAVKWNFDRLIDPAVRVPIRAAYPIEKTDVVDPLTVRVTLKHPYAAFLGALPST